MKPIALVAACTLLLALTQPGRAGPAESARAIEELRSLQYQEQPGNPTIGVHRLGTNVITLKQKGSGACGKAQAWNDAVHQSAWFGKLAKCWQLATADVVRICPIAGGRVSQESCIDLGREQFVTTAWRITQ